jgi:hypothetical protein
MEHLKKYDFLTQEECDTIVHQIISLESAVKRIAPDEYVGTSEDSLTGRYSVFNYLNISSINTIICPKLKEIFGPCVVQCWANIFRQGEGIDEHRHISDDSINTVLTTSRKIYMHKIPSEPPTTLGWRNCSFQVSNHLSSPPSVSFCSSFFAELKASGNVFLYGDPTIGTYYEGVKHDNKIGELSLFSPEMVHGVPKNTTDDMRISMAIDVHTGDEYLLNMLVSGQPKRFFYIR